MTRWFEKFVLLHKPDFREIGRASLEELRVKINVVSGKEISFYLVSIIYNIRHKILNIKMIDYSKDAMI